MDDGEETPREQTTNEQMEEYERLAAQERELRTEKREVLSDVSADLTGAVERAVALTGANVDVESVSNDGTTQRLTARLDRAALVAAVTEKLPDGFTIKRVNQDGTLSVEWSRRERSEEQRATAILQAIVREELETDAEEFITAAPSRKGVVERAVELGVPEALADKRLERLDDVGMVTIEEGHVYPDSDF